jgi:hypothetical protein
VPSRPAASAGREAALPSPSAPLPRLCKSPLIQKRQDRHNQKNYNIQAGWD